MKKLNQYDINLVNLSNNKHEYDFILDQDFFALFAQNLVNGGNSEAHVVLDKSTLLLSFDITIKGTVNVTCDRSLEPFDYPVDIQETLLVKFGEQEMELDENVLQIPHDAQTINMAQHLFDYIGVALPIKKLHPRFVVDEQTEGDILIYSTANEEESEENPENNSDEPVDPRWDILKNLNNN